MSNTPSVINTASSWTPTRRPFGRWPARSPATRSGSASQWRCSRAATGRKPAPRTPNAPGSSGPLRRSATGPSSGATTPNSPNGTSAAMSQARSRTCGWRCRSSRMARRPVSTLPSAAGPPRARSPTPGRCPVTEAPHRQPGKRPQFRGLGRERRSQREARGSHVRVVGSGRSRLKHNNVALSRSSGALQQMCAC